MVFPASLKEDLRPLPRQDMSDQAVPISFLSHDKHMNQCVGVQVLRQDCKIVKAGIKSLGQMR